MEYCEEVLRRFQAAGAGPGGAAALNGEAEDRALGVWAGFQIQIRDGRIEAVRFHVFGCPHTIAAASLLAELLEKQPAAALAAKWARPLADRLEVPEEKFGRLLVLEDALAAAAASVTQG